MSAGSSVVLSATWVVYLIVAGTLLAVAANAVTAALSLAGRSTRWTWAATLLGIVALGIVAPRAPSVQLVMANAVGATAEAATPVAPRSGIGALVELAALGRTQLESGIGRAIAFVSHGIPSAVSRPALIGWLIASATLLALYLIVNLRVSRERRRWPRERLHDTDVRVAPSAGPAVIGVLRAEIVVPRSLMERTAAEQQLILAHEREHLRARDNVLLALAWGVAIVLPWHPAVWYALARLRLAIELDCDARVLRGGAAPRSYGSLLIDMAARGAGIRVGTLALADGSTHLERRLLAMRSHKGRFALVRGGALCAVAGLLVLAACEAKMPTAAEVNAMDVAGTQKAMSSAQVLSPSKFDNADFFLDGVKKRRDEVLALDGKQIGSIEVVKGGRDTIFVTSKEVFDHMKRADSLPSRVMAPPPRGSSGAQPTYMIDGVLSDAAKAAALRPEYVRSVNVLKGAAAGSAYPNGLIEIKTGTTPTQMKERVPGPTSMRRTDTMVVGGASDAARASKMWGLAAMAAPQPDGPQRVVVMPAREPEQRKFPLTIGGIITPSGERVPASRTAGDSALRPLSKDYAITIDGVPATHAELSALPKDEPKSMTMWLREGDKHSSDPRAVNGLLEVTTKHAAKKD